MKPARFLFTLVISTLAVLGVVGERTGSGVGVEAIVATAFCEDAPSGGLSSGDVDAPVVFFHSSGPSLDVLPRDQGPLSRLTPRELTSSYPLALQRGHAQAASTQAAST
jgi:hypothetical protein